MRKSEVVDWDEDGMQVTSVDLWYPRNNDKGHVIQVGMVDVRVADDIRISYDFDRDGYVISQSEGGYEWDGEGEEPVLTWVEVAFVQAWQRSKEGR